jgi:2-amino-4-hydroxy-6-hydroxymethyldihydropteridine diphosphokinase
MKVVMALGSNLGNREANIEGAVAELNKIMEITHLSALIETDPVGGPSQPQYLNAVAIGESDLSPEELLQEALRIESELGRVRLEKWGPRIIDIDLITVGDIVMTTETLTLPHPFAHLRNFVLAPWAEIEPDATLPGWGSISVLLSDLDERE